jgi:hypothetical protein
MNFLPARITKGRKRIADFSAPCSMSNFPRYAQSKHFGQSTGVAGHTFSRSLLTFPAAPFSNVDAAIGRSIFARFGQSSLRPVKSIKTSNLPAQGRPWQPVRSK